MVEQPSAGAVEVTTFRLVDGVGMADFILANTDIDAWLRRQPGFRSRHICERGDGSVLDMLIWDSVEAGVRAAEGVTTEMAGSPVHAAIDQSSVDWSVSSIRHEVGVD